MTNLRRFFWVTAACCFFSGFSSCVTAEMTPPVSDPNAIVRQCAIDLQGHDWKRENAAFQQLSALIQSHPGGDLDYDPVIVPLMSHIGWGGIARKEAYQSAELLTSIGLPAVPALLQGLKSPEARLRWSCPEILAAIHPIDPSIVSALIPLINDSDPYVRRVAIESLGKLGPQARPAVPVLVQALQLLDQSAPGVDIAVPDAYENGYGRIDCHVSLIRILGISRPHVAAIASILEDRDPDVRVAAATALGDLGISARVASPQLQNSLHDSSAQVRINSADALGKIGDSSPAVIAALIHVLQTDEEKYARWAAAGSLGYIGPKAKATIPALKANTIPVLQSDISQDEGVGGGWVVLEALGEIGGADVMPYLARALDSPNDFTRQRAVVQLGNLGSLSRSTLPALRKRLTDSQPYVRQAAAEAITKIEHSRPR